MRPLGVPCLPRRRQNACAIRDLQEVPNTVNDLPRFQLGVFALVWQPFEAEAFATYMAGGTLFVDVWDADALMHVGTLAVPLRTLMRQQKGVVKIAMVRQSLRQRIVLRRTQSRQSASEDERDCLSSLRPRNDDSRS